MQGMFACSVIEGSTQGFTIDSDDFSLCEKADGLNPGKEAFLECFGINLGEDSAEGVVGRDSVGQLQELLEPSDLSFADLFDLGPGVCAAKNAAQGDDDDFKQVVAFGAVDAGVFQAREVIRDVTRLSFIQHHLLCRVAVDNTTIISAFYLLGT